MKSSPLQLIAISSVLFQLLYLSAAECWWTGCQSNSLAVKGCGQYNRTQNDAKDCKDGFKYYCCEIENAAPELSSDCWWTGCQPSSLAVTGCGQYNRTQNDAKDCKDGFEYYCCERDNAAPELSSDCWWTGCQLSSLAVTGCGQFNRTQNDTKNCKDGFEYYCCERDNAAPELSSDCWWTGCQPSSWANTGCGQYNQTHSKICEGGSDYYCCERENAEPDMSSDCWWTGCQPSSWSNTGCGQYNRNHSKICEGGSDYYCCERENAEPDMSSDCWWTGCQPSSWANTGCGQYNQTHSKTCEGGSDYYCCERENAAPEMSSDCWWTGCQPSSWANTGCGQYNRTQKDGKICEGGSEYYCCAKDQPSSPSPSNVGCWWTGCQMNSWAIVGCEQYNLTQRDIKDCDAGHEFYCCPGTSSPILTNNYTNCVWSSCQPNDLTDRGCPSNMTKISSQSCGENEGDIFECCENNQQTEDDDVNLISGESFQNFVKYLLLKGENYTIQPDSLPCLAIDVEKQSILQIKTEGIYICDLCPYFPQNRFVNVFLSNEPYEIEYNLKFEECFGFCFDKNDCVAFSYDYSDHACYIFNNTIGNFIQGAQWTTIFMTQPTGVLEDWTYSRHTSITGDVLQSSKENSFQTCLKKCNEKKNCNFVSHSLKTQECSMFSTRDKIKYIDLNYGFISAFQMSSILDSDAISRFIEVGDDIFDAASNLIYKSNECNSGKNETHSAFYSKSCFTSPGLGCDTATGCKACYYPEKTDKYFNLGICPDSEWVIFSEIKRTIQNSLRNCLGDPSCVAVGYDSSKKDARQLTFENFESEGFTTMFIMRYPITDSENHKTISKYDVLFNYDIEKVDAGSKGFQQMTGKTFKECLSSFESSSSLIRMSYAEGVCKVSSEEVKFILRSGKFLTVFKKPDITSPLLNYLMAPGISVEEGKAKQVIDSCINCEVVCAQKCSQEFKDWCSHFTIIQDSNKASCLFFDFFNDTVASSIILKQNEQTQLFTKLSGLNFTLESLNELSPFQNSDIYNCFQTDTENQQTATSLTKFDLSNTVNTGLQLRRKMGFFDLIKKAFKAVGNFTVDTVKSTVNGVVDTAKGVVNAVKNVVKGDLKKAKESFINIPIVKDVRNAVDLGKAVVTVDWDKARETESVLLQGQALDIATSFIPVGGKYIGKGLKAAGKAMKKQPKAAKRGGKRDTEKVNENNKKVSEDNKGNDKKRNNNCKQKNKTAIAKRQRPGGCDDDDEDKLCPAIRISNVIERAMSSCKNRKKNAICEFECEPGFDEPNKDVKCTDKGNRRLDWIQRPHCERISCGSSVYPLITLQTPHVNNFGSTDFGRFITVYVVFYNKRRKLPIWSIAFHQSTQFKSKDYKVNKRFMRENKFKPFPCSELTNYQANSESFYKSGWDQGHLTPANIARWSEKARLTSNLFINVAPQDPYTNQVPWQRLETAVECFSRRSRSLVVTGICSNSIGKTPGGLEVPACYWKMVCYRDENGKEQVVGFMTSNGHLVPLVEAQKKLRREEVYTPRSQKEIRRELQGTNASMRSPWLYAAVKVNSGRPVTIGGNAATWFPVNPLECERANDLSEDEKQAWIAGLPHPRKKKKGQTARTKRATDPHIKRGCHSISDFRNIQSLLGIDDEDNDDEEDSEEGNSPSHDDGGGTLVGVQKCNKRIIGYYTSWGDKRISGREIQRLTHVVYAFLEMREDGSIDVGSADRKNAQNVDEEINQSKDRLTNLMELARRYPHVKVMFAVGGWENSQYFSGVAASPQKRITFIASIIKMIQRYGFDGVDIDWEYPVTGGASEGISQDKQNYVDLMKEIRSALDNLANEAGRSEKFLLSFAGAAGQWTLDPGFDLPGLLKYADFVNIMTYDYFGTWASKWGAYTGPPSPLYFGMPARFSGKTNTDWTVKYYACKTKQPHKINMGVPFYGRYWENVGAPVDDEDGMWRTASQVNGKFVGGYVAWNKISEFLGKGGFEENFHEKSKAPYAWNAGSKMFLGYENKKSLESKVEYAVNNNLGGLMIWSVELDDDELSLLNTVYRASLCDKTNPEEINHKCSPIDEKRWWTSEDGDDMAGLCGRSAPLFKGYYPVCNPDDPGYSCCGPAGYCGSGEKYCDCPTCKNYGENPETILEHPIKPSVPVTWYFLNAEEGKRGRCGRKIPQINGVFPTCNPDDDNNYCCSNGDYCGSKPEYCDCNGCVNFKKNKNYRYGPKKWWDFHDGVDKAGKCGPNAPKIDGKYDAECEPNTKYSCCSKHGYCGSGPEFCDCSGCKKFT